MRILFATCAAALMVTGCSLKGGGNTVRDGQSLGGGEATSGVSSLIASAETAAPSSVTRNAVIMDHDGNILRDGDNGFTCLPDNPDTDGPDAMCLDASWLNLAQGLKSKEDPDYGMLGISYMLGGDSAVSNTDPYATEFTNDDDWVEGLGAHLMIAVPGEDGLNGFSTDPFNGGPWVMWPGTPYQHLMVPIDSYGR
jgi:hypothetical protein